MLSRNYHGRPPKWQLVIFLRTRFNSTLRLSQISELYCSLVHLNTYIYCTLAFFHRRLPTHHRMLPERHQIMPSRHWTLPAPQLFLVYPSSYVKHQIFLSIKIFDVLPVISRVRADIFPIVHAFQDLDLSSGILEGPGIYYLLGTYYSIQYYPLGHVEYARPTITTQ